MFRLWKYNALVATALLLFAPVVSAGTAKRPGSDRGTPGAAASAFFRFHMAHDMAFTPEGVALRAAWLAPSLLESCRDYFARARPADEEPPINGDPFTDSQEYPSSFAVGKSQITGDTARSPITLKFPGGEKRRVVLELVRADGHWLIRDLRFEDGSTLLEALASAPGAPTP